jgi:hypothetical protein
MLPYVVDDASPSKPRDGSSVKVEPGFHPVWLPLVGNVLVIAAQVLSGN